MQAYLTEIRLFACTYAPRNWTFCHGQILHGDLLGTGTYAALFSLLGTRYGGDGRTTFGVPDLRGRVPIHRGVGAGLRERKVGQRDGAESVLLSPDHLPPHTHTLRASRAAASRRKVSDALLAAGRFKEDGGYASAKNLVDMSPAAVTASLGGGRPHKNMQPYLALHYCMALNGTYPSRGGGVATEALTGDPAPPPYRGEVRMHVGALAPAGFALCNGQELPIGEHSALFSLLGTVFGGDGSTTFGLPDLRGRIPIGAGPGTGLSDRRYGSTGGTEVESLTLSEMPQHSHTLRASKDPAQSSQPENQVTGSCTKGLGMYKTQGQPSHSLGHDALDTADGGSGASHENLQPYATLSYIIALDGEYPGRN